MDINTIKAIAFNVIADEITYEYENEGSTSNFLAFADGVRSLAFDLINNIKEEKTQSRTE